MKDYSSRYNGSHPSLWKVYKMLFETKNRSNVKELKSQIPLTTPHLSPSSITWLGHSSLLLQYEGLNILTDPLFSERASPLSFIGPKRYVPLPLSLEELPPIDLILISHNHYDHLDLKVAKYFKNSVTWCIPQGLSPWFKKRGIKSFVELEWWESFNYKSLKITAAPIQHWSKRTFKDTFKSLWCSYVLEFPDFKFFFTGDSGFNAEIFQEIAAKFAPFDLSAIPIGAYDPEWFMQFFHMNPEEALQVHQILRSKRSIPIHWGTFPMTYEPITEPPQRLALACEDERITTFKPIAIGETIAL